jgi:hypothetical protein
MAKLRADKATSSSKLAKLKLRRDIFAEICFRPKRKSKTAEKKSIGMVDTRTRGQWLASNETGELE